MDIKEFVNARLQELADEHSIIRESILEHELEIEKLEKDKEFINVRIAENLRIHDRLSEDGEKSTKDESTIPSSVSVDAEDDFTIVNNTPTVTEADDTFLCPECSCLYSTDEKHPELGICPNCFTKQNDEQNVPIPEQNASMDEQEPEFMEVEGTSHLEYRDHGESVELTYMGGHRQDVTWDVIYTLVDMDKKERRAEITSLLGDGATNVKVTAMNQFVKAVEKGTVVGRDE